MIASAAMRLVIVLFVAAACGGSTGMSGPTINNRVEAEADPPPPEIQSNDILGRDAVTNRASVKHVLVSWRGLDEAYAGQQDPRGRARTREQADELAAAILAKVRAGEAIEPLMIQFSEDPGSNVEGNPYPVAPDAQLVFEFKRLSLRLNVGEAGLVLTQFGWHVIKRVE